MKLIIPILAVMLLTACQSPKIAINGQTACIHGTCPSSGPSCECAKTKDGACLCSLNVYQMQGF